MKRLQSVLKIEDIPEYLRDTPVGNLFKYHNLRAEFDEYTLAELLIGMCIDNRKRLQIPDNFAYIIRSGGANLKFSEFKVSYAIGVGGVKSIALMGHNNCGMVKLDERKDLFVEGLVKNANWDRARAEQHFNDFSPVFEIGNEIDFVLSEAKRLKILYPAVQIVPMLYRVEDNLLYLIADDEAEYS